MTPKTLTREGVCKFQDAFNNLWVSDASHAGVVKAQNALLYFMIENRELVEATFAFVLAGLDAGERKHEARYRPPPDYSPSPGAQDERGVNWSDTSTPTEREWDAKYNKPPSPPVQELLLNRANNFFRGTCTVFYEDDAELDRRAAAELTRLQQENERLRLEWNSENKIADRFSDRMGSLVSQLTRKDEEIARLKEMDNVEVMAGAYGDIVQMQNRITELEKREGVLREALETIARMSTLPDHAANTVTLVAAHTLARAALDRKEG